MTAIRTILLAEDSPADAEMAVDALREARLANPIVHVEDGVEAMAGIAPFVADSGEGRWTVAEAIDLEVSAPVITLSLMERLRSRDKDSFTDKLLAAMRNQFGGHAVMTTTSAAPTIGSKDA